MLARYASCRCVTTDVGGSEQLDFYAAILGSKKGAYSAICGAKRWSGISGFSISSYFIMFKRY